MITVNTICPVCEEKIELEVLDNNLSLVECPSCIVLLSVKNGKAKRSEVKFNTNVTVESLLQDLENYTEKHKLN